MSPSQVMACYRLYAAHGIEIARGLQDRGRKIALLNMAFGWSWILLGTARESLSSTG
jgi:hypothetical protein